MKKQAAKWTAVIATAAMAAAMLPGTQVFAKGKPEIKVVMPTAGNYENTPAVEAAIDEKLEELGINATVSLKYLNWGHYDEQVNLMLTNSDECDLVFLYGTLNTKVNSGMVLDLTNYWENAGEEIKELIPDWVIEGTKINDELYGIPCNIERSHEATFVVNKEIANELGFEFEDDRVYTLDECHEMLVKAKEAYPDKQILVPQLGNTLIGGWSWENMGDSYNIGVIEQYGTEDKVISVTECEDFLTLAHTMREWYQEGLIMQDILSNAENFDQALTEGRVVAEFSDGCEPAGQSDSEDFKKYAFTVVPNWVNSTAGVRMVYAVNAMTNYPDESFAVLEQLYANKEIQTLLGYGIEGENYVIDETGRANYPDGVTAENDTYTTIFSNWLVVPNADTGFAPYFFQADRWEKVKEYDEGAVAKSNAVGCVFDSYAVVDEYAACINVMNKYYNSILSGAVDPDETIAMMKEELEVAGEAKVIEEKQRQLDAHMAAQN